MTQEYMGAIVLEVDGQEIEVTSFDVKTTTGRKLVKTMNKTGRAKGYCQGIATYDLSLSVVIPDTGDLDWENIVDAKVTLYPLNNQDKRTSYLGCFSIDISEKYQVDNEAQRDLTMAALRKVDE
ncbi:TPA: phage tail protein [Shigella sonnei]|nr:phage tail protein [Escherichia coli]EFX1701617.1 phage tail protein [Shigella sonnei]EEZ5551884.1 phage tail protein [Escherichia coli]EFX1719080.1 phage tail protein [Shigella sonnei]EFX2368302.1 phage tail protein [Shigella sonnei]